MENETELQIMQISSSYTSLLPGDLSWEGPRDSIAIDISGIRKRICEAGKPLFVLKDGNNLGVTNEGQVGKSREPGDGKLQLIACAPALTAEMLGDESFCRTYGTPYAFYCGAMANGISSEKMLISLGKEGILGSFGAGGLSLQRIEAAILEVKSALPHGPYVFNLLNSPNEPLMEQKTIELYLTHGIHAIEASAYLLPTVNLVHYRAAGLSVGENGRIRIGNRIIAKLSRKEIARKFMSPPPGEILKALVESGHITEQQADLAKLVPLADDITVEADSGGHTDNRPLVCVIPAVLALRDEIQEKYRYDQPVRVGAAGGIGTPSAAAAALTLGAAYFVTGSINQACIESGTSDHVHNLLAQAEMTDVAMAPAGDMFEMGVKVQVLKRGTMFAMRAQKLYELYSRYASLDDIPPDEREKLETQVFKSDINSIWNDCYGFFSEHDTKQIERANSNPKDKMALVFRWYLGLSSKWSISGEKGREMDYQIWCSPAMGAFNDWVKGTFLENPIERRVADINKHILAGCAYMLRVQQVELQGIRLPAVLKRYLPNRDLK